MGSGYWFCSKCNERVEPEHVTYTETHDECGQWVSWVTDDLPPYDDLRAQLAEKDKVIEGLREAIAVFEFNTEHDPIYNLEGAISDLEGRIKDEVILQTLYRVQEQLGRCYHAALNAAPNTDGAQ